MFTSEVASQCQFVFHNKRWVSHPITSRIDFNPGDVLLHSPGFNCNDPYKSN
ncbi:hypothetical protein Tmari_0826 [Thermotoga maritima MSB8]|nr:hypothetical protein Tmari_0826 [Thermotoga maritima MSB8]